MLFWGLCRAVSEHLCCALFAGGRSRITHQREIVEGDIESWLR